MSAEDIEYMDGYKEFPTKESALNWLDNYLSLDERNNLIRALEQEPYEEAISRQAVLDMLEDIGSLDTETDKQYARSILESLPSVRSQSMIGHWRPIYQGECIINYRCSECEFGNTFGKNIYRMNYCPNCGAKMEVEE